MRTQLARLRIDDLEFLLDAESEDMVTSFHRGECNCFLLPTPLYLALTVQELPCNEKLYTRTRSADVLSELAARITAIILLRFSGAKTMIACRRRNDFNERLCSCARDVIFFPSPAKASVWPRFR